jgi:tetratricopeptide (TPR) repeat protein
MAELVDGLVAGLPSEVRDALVARAEGIPTYAVETVRALIDRDLVVPRGGTYVLADPELLDLETIGPSASLQALVSARLDRLSADERYVVDRASVAGDSVEPELLAELCTDVPDLDRVLVGLVRAQIFTVDHDRLSSEQGRYQFVQSVVRHVAYATLSRRERKQAHLHVLEAQTREGSEELTSVAAQHAVWAIESAPDDGDVEELTSRAVDLLRRAAVRAQTLGAPGEASGHLRRALALVPEGLDRLELELDLARACHDAGRYDEAMEQARAARMEFQALGALDREVEAASIEADTMLREPGDPEAAVALLQPYYDDLRRTQPRSRSFAVVMGSYQMAMCRARRADMDLYAEALAVADVVGDQTMVARVLNNMFVLMDGAGIGVLADLFLEKSIEVAREAHDPLRVAMGLCNRSGRLLGEDVPLALSVLEDATDASRRLGNVEWISLAHANRTIAQFLAGHWDDVEEAPAFELLVPDLTAMVVVVAAIVRIARGLEPAPVLAAKGELRETSMSYWRLGELLGSWYAHDPSVGELAREFIEESLTRYGTGDDFHLMYGFAAQMALDADDRALVERLEQVVDGANAPVTGLQGHRALLEAVDSARHGPDGETEEFFRQAIGCYDAWGSPVYAARGRAAYGAWLHKQGREEEAEPLLAAARATYAELGAVAWLAELDDQLRQVETSPRAG